MSKYEDNSNNFMTFIFGAIAGAAAVMFLDKDMRAKVQDKLQDAKDLGTDAVDKVKTKALDTRDMLEDMAEEKLVDAQEKIEDNRAAREHKPAKRNSR